MIKKKMATTKKVLIAEALFVLGIFVYLFFTTAPSQVYPLQGMVVSDSDLTFEIENGEEVLISINEDFINPISLREGDEIYLVPGDYFWKVKSEFRESDVRTFTIYERVDLQIDENNYSVEIKNKGNTDLNVSKKASGRIVEFFLTPGSLKEVEKENATYEGVKA